MGPVLAASCVQRCVSPLLRGRRWLGGCRGPRLAQRPAGRWKEGRRSHATSGLAMQAVQAVVCCQTLYSAGLLALVCPLAGRWVASYSLVA